MLSTAWSRTDPFWRAWDNDNPTWIRLKATADTPGLFAKKFLEEERRELGEEDFKQEYLGIPGGGHGSLFTWDLFERATQIHVPKVAPGFAFAPPQEQAEPMENPFQTLNTAGAFR